MTRLRITTNSYIIRYLIMFHYLKRDLNNFNQSDYRLNQKVHGIS